MKEPLGVLLKSARVLPFEFTVDGPPVSHQAKKRARLVAWRAQVRDAAERRWPADDAPITESVELIVTYYHEKPAIRMDNDNMVKPIQDALIGLVYQNDHQVTDTRLRKTSLDGAFQVRGMSMVLAEAFSRDREFLHIVLKTQPDHAEILA